MSTIDELMSRAATDVAKGRTPACQVAVAKDGEVLAFEAFGTARPTTRFAIFSATKPIVAAAVWHHLADGSLDPDATIGEYVPELAARGFERVRVDHVLLHTAGFPNAAMDHAEGADPQRRRARFAQWSIEWEPGSRFEYHSGSAHWVLMDLLERLNQQDPRDVVERRVSVPLGLPRVLGIGPDDQDDIAPLVAMTADAVDDFALRFNDPAVRAAGVPGGGAFMTAADLACFYQGLLHNPGGVWDAEVLRDATSHIRCGFPDPLLGAPVNRTRGLVVAGDDGQHVLRYAIFGSAVSPGAFGHAGAHGQVGWTDPATGISFAYLHSGVWPDQMMSGARSMRLASIAAELDV